MSLPKSIAAYPFEAQALASALVSGGGRITLGSAREAAKWRARAYMYRALLRPTGDTSYETMKMIVEGNDVVISFVKGSGIFTSIKGETIKLAEVEPKDPLLEIAKGFAKGLTDG